MKKKDYTLITGLSVILAAFVAFMIGIHITSNVRIEAIQHPPPTTGELSHYSIYFDGDDWWFKNRTGMVTETSIGLDMQGHITYTSNYEVVKSGTSYTSSNAAYAGVLTDIEAHRKTALEQEKQRKKQMAGENVPSLTDLQPVRKFEMDTNLLLLKNASDEAGRNMSNLVADLQRQLDSLSNYCLVESNALQAAIDGKQDKPITNNWLTNIYGTNYCVPTNWIWTIGTITNSCMATNIWHPYTNYFLSPGVIQRSAPSKGAAKLLFEYHF